VRGLLFLESGCEGWDYNFVFNYFIGIGTIVLILGDFFYWNELLFDVTDFLQSCSFFLLNYSPKYF
jgi:hypothetical protein